MTDWIHNIEDRPGCETMELERDEALRLLAGANYGRIVFTQNALPAIRPRNHLLDEEMIIVRTRLSTHVPDSGRASGITHTAAAGEVVAYQADELDPVRCIGW
ncbi:pyridoxamine 5'-phosphate oxidase family protein, partial [Nocardia gipuzkoensis]